MTPAAAPDADPSAAPERATIAVFDLDGTLTRYDTYLSFLLRCLGRRKLRLLRCWQLPLDVTLFKLKRRDNAWLKTRFLAAVLGGVATIELKATAERFVDHVLANGMRPGAIAALRRHQAAGHRTVLLSAGLDLFVPLFATRLGFDHCLCTAAEQDADGSLTGRIAGANCYGPEKRRRLDAFLGAARSETHVLAYADHLSDLALLRWADEAVLVNPSRRARRAAAGMTVTLW